VWLLPKRGKRGRGRVVWVGARAVERRFIAVPNRTSDLSCFLLFCLVFVIYVYFLFAAAAAVPGGIDNGHFKIKLDTKFGTQTRPRLCAP
jgi:hypothetical protein